LSVGSFGQEASKTREQIAQERYSAAYHAHNATQQTHASHQAHAGRTEVIVVNNPQRNNAARVVGVVAATAAGALIGASVSDNSVAGAIAGGLVAGTVACVATSPAGAAVLSTPSHAYYGTRYRSIYATPIDAINAHTNRYRPAGSNSANVRYR
jgi:ElaB/YqjD/DUF883 family membrane-anchored ribosome-binding protein